MVSTQYIIVQNVFSWVLAFRQPIHALQAVTVRMSPFPDSRAREGLAHTVKYLNVSHSRHLWPCRVPVILRVLQQRSGLDLVCSSRKDAPAKAQAV